ncbi:MAG: hypothetical protein IJB35_02165 [Oscillospiraceae bacterium]|nr:hypothetical protein [Oscillospiraceae bacterium]
MYPLIYPAVPALEISINGNRIGMLQEYEITTKTDITPLYVLGNSRVQDFQTGTKYYSITLKRLILDRKGLPSQYDPSNLTGFTLVLRSNLQTMEFGGCHWVRIRESYKLGETVAEELELVALSCLRTAIA